MAFRSYQKIYGQRMAVTTLSWGGVAYGNILHVSGESVPDSVGVSNETQVYGVGSSSAHVVAINQNYLLPYQFDIVSAVDGIASGSFKVTLYGYGDTAGSMARVSSIIVQLHAVSSSGVVREICDPQTVWSGNEYAMYQETKTIAAMYWFPLNANLSADERLLFNIKVVGYSGGYTGNILAWIKLHHSKNTDELSITLPFII